MPSPLARFRTSQQGALVLLIALSLPCSFAADITNPAAVTGLLVAENSTVPADLDLTWDAVTTDAAGQEETISEYNIYRGLTPDFVPDKSGGTNRIGTSVTTSYTDPGAHGDGTDYFYLLSAVDSDGNESVTRPATVTTPPVLSGNWTETTIELNWTEGQPINNVAGYKVYYGRKSGVYEFVDDVGLAINHSLTGLALWTNWYSAVVAVDLDGNETDFSNEHIDAVAGRVRVRAHDESKLCWGAAKCPPAAGEEQRNDGWQLNIPTTFPEGDWKSVIVRFTMDSKLCEPPEGDNNTKCGDTNPCLTPPCNGNPAYNTCGDPWDRGAHLFLVLDEECISSGGSCKTNSALELMNTVTPFGTDALPPEGTGVVPPRTISMDITPYTPLLTGTRYVGAHIGHYVQAGWHVTTEFEFSKRDDEASPKPPAAGIQVLFWGGAQPPAASLSIPATATQVITRLFTTGHGGNSYCDGGANDGESCDTGCPGGSCQNCDEFCHRTNQILVDGGVAWETVPWRDCCYPRGSAECAIFGVDTGCSEWNACGTTSCNFDRAGWCPGEIACHYNMDDGCDQDLDMTAHFPPGGTYEVDYNVLPLNGSWSVSLVAYWYE